MMVPVVTVEIDGRAILKFGPAEPHLGKAYAEVK
jgi:hypothetical protein